MQQVAIGVAPAKPPYVTFEYRPIEDREASLKEKRYVAKDVAFAIITPPGSKDRIPQQVDFWFEKLTNEVAADRYPSQWLEHYRALYAAWKAGNELPIDGTSVKNWNQASPAQIRAMLDLHIMTVEQMAEANEETVARLGMGGRALRQQAKDYITTANSQAAEIASLRKKVAELEAAKAQPAAATVK